MSSAGSVEFFDNTQWSDIVQFVLDIVLLLIAAAALFAHIRQTTDKNKLFAIIYISAIVFAIFKAIQISLIGSKISYEPLTSSPTAALSAIVLFSPRFSTAATCALYTAVCTLWHTAVDVLKDPSADQKAFQPREGLLLQEDGPDAHSHAVQPVRRIPRIIWFLYSLLMIELCFLVGTIVGSICSEQETVTAVDEVKDIVLYIAYTTCLVVYAYKLCSLLLAMARRASMDDRRGCVETAASAMFCCPNLYDKLSGSQLSATETLHYVIAKQVDHKFRVVAVVSIAVSIGVTIRCIKAFFTALTIVEVHALPSQQTTPSYALLWLCYHIVGELMPYFALFVMTVKPNVWRRIFCQKPIPETELPHAAIPASKDRAGQHHAERFMADRASFLEADSSGAGGYTDLLSSSWMDRDSSQELVRGYDAMGDY
jgi:hypothetical protein